MRKVPEPVTIQFSPGVVHSIKIIKMRLDLNDVVDVNDTFDGHL